MDETELLKIIDRAAAEKQTSLYLSAGNLTSLPDAIGKLTSLQELHLDGNQLTSLPEAVGKLTHLQTLWLHDNQLTSLPEAIGKLTGLTTLYLDHNQLSSLPPEFGKLTGLTELSLYNNQLSSLPPELGKLTNLTTLDLYSNQLSSLPPELGKLTNLTALYLHGNHLSSLPPELGKLTNLTTLSLSNNQLSSLPPELGKLTNLRVLYLSHNQLSSLSPQLGKLTNLRSLVLLNNQLRSLPPDLGKLTGLTRLDLKNNQLRSLPPELGKLTNLKGLYLYNNQLRSLPPEILNLNVEIKWEQKIGGEKGIFLADNPWEMPPVEIIKQGTEAVRNYFKSVETKDISRVYEAKLLIVGEGGVGKTCLMKRLMAPDKPIDQNELTTEGIDINQWFIETDKVKKFRANFWDFGGQEIYHATHQFFLTKRSLYLFVWAARTDDDLTSFDYWLNIVKLLSDNSPVIMVLNKIDERIKSIDEKSLQEKFNNIVCFDRVSALNGTRIEYLVKTIREQISNLPHVGDVLPTVWVDIRRRLEKEALEKNYISYDVYKAICAEFGLDEKSAEHLSRYYHDLGVFLHFLDNPILREIVFLKPDWATNAVYKVVDTREIQQNHGKFHFNQLRKIWDNYPEDKYVALLELMKKFELCFQIPGTENYIVPELLTPGRPDFEWDYAGNLRFEYRYDFMPAGIITRFIVRTHDIIKGEIYWKSGVVLQRENTEALVISERLNRKIRIWVRGNNKKELLAIIRREVDYIHKTLNNPDVSEMIPCICGECEHSSEPYFHNYADLLKARQKGKSQIECKKSFEAISIEKLLGDYKRKEDKKLEINYYEGGHMEIKKQIIKGKHVRVISAEEVNYTEQNGITKADMQDTLEKIHKMAEKDRKMLAEYYQQFENLKSQSDKESMANKIKRFLVNYGIAVAQHLTAAGIYDLGKMWLG